jgi:choline-sulfatase
MSNNGFYMGNRGLASKWSHFKESLLIPLGINHPIVNNHHSERFQIALNIDIQSPILELPECPIPPDYHGKSLVPFIFLNPVHTCQTDFLCEHLMHLPATPI